MSDIIEFEDLHKRFGKTKAVDGLSLAVPEGRILALLGPNGAGKTTTIKTMLNLYQPDQGRASVLGVDSRRLRPEQFRSIGYVSENQQLPEWMTAMAAPERIRAAMTDPVRTVITANGWKLNCSPLGEHELYNLQDDPLETTNTFGSRVRGDCGWLASTI